MVLGAVGPAKNNAARRCVVGNFLCIKAVGNDGSVPKAAVGVYGDETDAQAVAAFVEDPSDVSLKSAHDDAITRELHEESEVPLSILKAVAANFRDFADGGGGGGGALPADPLLGTSFAVLNFVVVNNNGVHTGGLYSGDVHIVSHNDDDTFVGDYEHEGTTYSNTFLRQFITRQRLPPPPADTFLSLLDGLEGVIDPRTAELLKRLPRSHASTDAATLSSLDILEVCKHAGIATPITDVHATDFNLAAAVYITTIDTIVCGQAMGRVWPDRPDRLGQELKRITGGGGANGGASGGGAGGPPAPRHPLSEALQSRAEDDAVYREFLARSVSVTITNDRLATAATSDFIRTGALEAYLVKAFPGDSTAVAAAKIKNFASLASQNADELMAVIMFIFTPAHDAGGHQQSGQSSGGPSGGATRITIQQPDTSGSDEERRCRISLREDADQLLGDTKRMQTLDALYTLKDDSVQLFAAVHKIADGDGLKRLVSSSMDLEKALTGKHILAQPTHPCALHNPSPHIPHVISPMRSSVRVEKDNSSSGRRRRHYDEPSASAVAGSAHASCDRATSARCAHAELAKLACRL